MEATIQSLRTQAEQVLPRLLSQVARDPNSSLEGCWDRHWWHYKIRDFPSIILQQGGYALHLAAGLDLSGAPKRAFLDELARASARFWNQRACRSGAFEEYYPHEQGYPPLAFSTLAMAKLVDQGVVELEEIHPGLVIATKQLLGRFEPQAANQQLAGTAALAMIRKLDARLVSAAALERVMDRSFALQQEEGWFPEYEGPDLGYLSVSLDCLWDLHDASGDPRCLKAIDKAVSFIGWFTEEPPHQVGMHNARNTDYLVPYGLARTAMAGAESAGLAVRILQRCFAGAAEPAHFLAAVDERYWCHYTGHSLFRAVALLENQTLPDTAGQPPSLPTGLPGSGHHRLQSEGVSVLVSGHKGGIVTADWGHGLQASDFGWVVNPDRCESWVTHWWSTEWRVDATAQEIVVSGPMVPHRELVSTPLRHLLLRLASRLLGRRLIQRLKQKMIFKSGQGPLHFERRIRLEEGSLVLRDRIRGAHEDDQCHRAPRASKRHVASADSFHLQDAGLPEGVEMTEEWGRDQGALTVETRLRPCRS